MNKTFKRASIVAGGLGAIASISIASFAFFTAVSHVTAEGDTDTAQVVSARDAVIALALYPGECSDIRFTLHNPNSHSVNGIREITKVDFGSVDGAQNYLRMPYIAAEGSTPNGVLVAHGYDMQPVAAGGDRQVVLPNAICLDPSAPDSVQGKAVTVNFDFTLKQAVGTEYPTS